MFALLNCMITRCCIVLIGYLTLHVFNLFDVLNAEFGHKRKAPLYNSEVSLIQTIFNPSDPHAALTARACSRQPGL